MQYVEWKKGLFVGTTFRLQQKALSSCAGWDAVLQDCFDHKPTWRLS